MYSRISWAATSGLVPIGRVKTKGPSGPTPIANQACNAKGAPRGAPFEWFGEDVRGRTRAKTDQPE
jgi:hypothetical protein